MVNQIDDLLIPNNDNLDELNEEKHLKRKHIIYTAALYFSFISVVYNFLYYIYTKIVFLIGFVLFNF